MTKIRNFLKTNQRKCLLIFFILEFFISIWITPNKYDSEFFIKQMQEMSIWDFISMRYQTWTSRIFIETLICLILPKTGIIWAMLNTIMMTILGYSILKLFVKEDNKILNWMAICFIFIYPLDKIASCDWGAGSMNYTWPLAMLLFSMIPIAKIQRQEKIAKFMYPIYSAALVFACNQEQCCMLAFCAYTIFTIYHILKNKKVHPFLVVQCIFALFSLLFIATCPRKLCQKNRRNRDLLYGICIFGFS